MILAILGWLKKNLTETYQNKLECYVKSKNPTTASEVEYWIRYYDQHASKGFL